MAVNVHVFPVRPEDDPELHAPSNEAAANTTAAIDTVLCMTLPSRLDVARSGRPRRGAARCEGRARSGLAHACGHPSVGRTTARRRDMATTTRVSARALNPVITQVCAPFHARRSAGEFVRLIALAALRSAVVIEVKA